MKKRVPRGTWTLERCREAAAQCKTRAEFKRRFTTGYRRAHRMGWTDVFAHMPEYQARPPKWSFTRAEDIAARYGDTKTFYREQPKLCAVAHWRGWFLRITRHMTRIRAGKPLIWTKEACAEAAKSHKSRSCFKLEAPSAYVIARAKGWLEEICAHMPRAGGNAWRAIYVIRQRETRRIYVGLSYAPLGRYRAHLCSPSRKMRSFMAKPHVFRVVTPMLEKTKAAVSEQYLIRRLREMGWEVINLKRGGDMGGVKKKWTHERLQSVANEVETRGEMVERHHAAYAAAHKMRLLDQIFSGHKNGGYITSGKGSRRNRLMPHTAPQIRG